MADEKFDEKEMEKRDEKSAEEKSWEEKWQRDPVGSVVWAVILIWAGLVFMAANLGWLDWLQTRNDILPGVAFFAQIETWGIIMLGAGIIIGLGALYRTIQPEYRRPLGGDIFLALLFIGIGLSNLFGWDIVWPLILIALGLSFVVRGMFRRR